MIARFLLVFLLIACCGFGSLRSYPTDLDSPKDDAAPHPPDETVKTLTIYTPFDPERLKPVLADFTRQTGIEIEFVTDEADLLVGRLLREGDKTTGDLLLIPNAARANQAAAAGLLRSEPIAALDAIAPAAYRDADAHWYGIASFALALAIADAHAKPTDISRYQDLAKPEWHSRVCIPPLSRPGNRALLAALMFHDGADTFQNWLTAVAANAAAFAPAPIDPSPSLAESDDFALIRELGAGVCDVTLVGSRALSMLAGSEHDDDKQLLGKISVIWPNQSDTGAVVDVVAGGIIAASAKTEMAARLLAYLASDDSQRLLADALSCYPIKPGVPLSNPVTRWGPLSVDKTPLSIYLNLERDAGTLAERSGWP